MDLDKLWTALEAVFAVWKPFVGALILLGGLIWAVLQFAYNTRLSSKDSEIALLTRKLADKPDASQADDKPSFVDSVLRVQFYGDDRTPTENHRSNIHSWFVWWSPTVNIESSTPEGKKVQLFHGSKSYVMIVNFDKPTRFHQAIVSFSEAGFPSYLIQQASDRHVVIAINGDVPLGSMELRLQK